MRTRVVEFGLLAFLLCGAASAQETWGSVRGAVTDPSGGAVPGAELQLSGGALPRPLIISTDAAGAYRFAQVPAANGYSLTATAPGFRTAKAAGLNVDLGKATGLGVEPDLRRLREICGATAVPGRVT